MSNVICLSDYKISKQPKHYLENYQLVLNYIHTESKTESKKEIERRMQLEFMRMLTKNIQK